HPRRRIGQIVDPSTAPNNRPAICVEAKEPDTGLPSGFYISSEIQLGKRIKRRKIRQQSAPHSRHPKRDKSNPGGPVEFLQMHTTRQLFPELSCVHTIVQKRQVQPRLPPFPVTGRQRPRPMIQGCKWWMHVFLG